MRRAASKKQASAEPLDVRQRSRPEYGVRVIVDAVCTSGRSRGTQWVWVNPGYRMSHALDRQGSSSNNSARSE